MEDTILRDAVLAGGAVLLATVALFFFLRARYGALEKDLLLMYFLCAGIMSVGVFVLMAGARLTYWFGW